MKKLRCVNYYTLHSAHMHSFFKYDEQCPIPTKHSNALNDLGMFYFISFAMVNLIVQFLYS